MQEGGIKKERKKGLKEESVGVTTVRRRIIFYIGDFEFVQRL